MTTENKNNVIPAELTSDEIWAKTDVIRKTFAPNLTPVEFKIFTGLGYSLGANPYNREIWAVKYGTSPAKIFLGRDFYRRKAQEQEDYEGHVVRAVYEGDDFQMDNGVPNHKWSFKGRGQILGAYCIVYREGKKPFESSVRFDEYYEGMWVDPTDHSQGKKKTYKNGRPVDMSPTTWDTKDETMIKKVAEAQGLRGAYQGIFKGTYDESEAVEVHAEATVVEEDEDPMKPQGRKSLNEVLGEQEEDSVDPSVNGQADPDPEDDPAPAEKKPEKEPEPETAKSEKKKPEAPKGEVRKESEKPKAKAKDEKPKLKKGSDDWDIIEKQIQGGHMTVQDVLEDFSVAKPFLEHFKRLQAESQQKAKGDPRPNPEDESKQGELL